MLGSIIDDSPRESPAPRENRASRLRAQRASVINIVPASPISRISANSPQPTGDRFIPNWTRSSKKRRRSSLLSSGFRRASDISTTSSRRQSLISYEKAKRPKKWLYLRKNIHRIILLGQSDGTLPRPLLTPDDDPRAKRARESITGMDEEIPGKKNVLGDPITTQTQDVDFIHEAIPFLPVPLAIFCFLFNVVLPGTGTVFSGAFGLCFGQPRVNMKESRRIITFITNVMVGASQFMTVSFFLVGWFWSIAWGGLLFIHSMEYRQALLERRKVAVATQAIEAITKDSILHHRDVTALVRTQVKKQNRTTKKQSNNTVGYWRKRSNDPIY